MFTERWGHSNYTQFLTILTGFLGPQPNRVCALQRPLQSLMQQMLRNPVLLLRARHCSRLWGYDGGSETEKVSASPRLHVLAGEDTKTNKLTRPYQLMRPLKKIKQDEVVGGARARTGLDSVARMEVTLELWPGYDKRQQAGQTDPVQRPWGHHHLAHPCITAGISCSTHPHTSSYNTARVYHSVGGKTSSHPWFH